MKSTENSVLGAFKNLAVFVVSEALRHAITEASDPSRVAALVAAGNDAAELYIYDEHGLLNKHTNVLKRYFLESDAWRGGKTAQAPKLEISSLITAAALMFPISIPEITFLYVRFFSENHKPHSNPGPAHLLLQHASQRLIEQLERLSKGGRLESAMLRIDIENYSQSAIVGHIYNKQRSLVANKSETKSIRIVESVNIRNVIDCIIGVSLSVEEGRPPKGVIGFVGALSIEASLLTAAFSADDGIPIKNYKHVRKILQTVEGTDQILVANDKTILGICSRKSLPGSTIFAEFRGRKGEIIIDGEFVASFSNGKLDFRRLTPNWHALRSAIKKWSINSAVHPKLANFVSNIAINAILSQNGCTIVLDPNGPALTISSQRLVNPLDLSKTLNRNITAAMAHVDGAIHINPQAQLLAFGCLLDGKTSIDEERARGARYNSALRFAQEHPECIVVVVSVDGHITLFIDGKSQPCPHI